MSDYEPKVGDRVRIVVEGEVMQALSDTVILRDTEDTGYVINRAPIVSIERLPDPLPTTPGSLVRFGGGFAHLNEEGDWIDDSGQRYTPKYLRNYFTDDPITVLFDAEAE